MDELREKIFANQDLKYKQFHSRLCPNTDNIIGVRLPKLKEIAKEMAKLNQIDYVKNETKYYEEIMIQGLIIGMSKLSMQETKKYLEIFIPKIDNWAICDSVCASLKITKKHPEEMYEFLQKYLKSENEFEIRFAIIMLLDYYINEKYIDEILEIIDNIKHEGYYVKMGIAWLISVAYVKQKEKTKDYLKQNNLDKFTYNKALRKIIESNRVSKEEKEEIRGKIRK